MAAGEHERGIEHAKDAVADKPKWSQTHLLLAQAYFASVVVSTKPLKAEDRDAALATSLSVADDAISAAEAEGVSYVKAQALALKTDIALIQGHKEEASGFARESFAADPSDLSGRLAMAQSLFSMGNVDEGIRVLEEARGRSSSAANVSYMLGQALLNRGTPQDVNPRIRSVQHGQHREVVARTGGPDHDRSDQGALYAPATCQSCPI